MTGSIIKKETNYFIIWPGFSSNCEEMTENGEKPLALWMSITLDERALMAETRSNWGWFGGAVTHRNVTLSTVLRTAL